jgi:hypothetical protein
MQEVPFLPTRFSGIRPSKKGAIHNRWPFFGRDPEAPGCLTQLKYRSATGEKLDQQNHQRHYQQQMNEPSKRVGSDNSQCPQNKKDYKDRPKHVVTS